MSSVDDIVRDRYSDGEIERGKKKKKMLRDPPPLKTKSLFGLNRC